MTGRLAGVRGLRFGRSARESPSGIVGRRPVAALPCRTRSGQASGPRLRSTRTAGGRMLSAAFEFLGELLPAQGGGRLRRRQPGRRENPQPAAALHRGGRWRSIAADRHAARRRVAGQAREVAGADVVAMTRGRPTLRRCSDRGALASPRGSRHPVRWAHRGQDQSRYARPRSKRSSCITLLQAATKSRTNFSCPSAEA